MEERNAQREREREAAEARARREEQLRELQVPRSCDWYCFVLVRALVPGYSAIRLRACYKMPGTDSDGRMATELCHCLRTWYAVNGPDSGAQGIPLSVSGLCNHYR